MHRTGGPGPESDPRRVLSLTGAPLSDRVAAALDDGYTVETVEGLPDGDGLARAACVVADHDPPDRDVSRVLAAVEEASGGTPPVVVVAADADGVAAALDAGAVDALVRSAVESTLAARVQRVLGDRESDADDDRGSAAGEGDEPAAPEHDRVERVFGRMTDGVFAVDDSWTVTFVNDRFEELLGRDAADVVGTNLWESFPAAVTGLFYEKYHEAMARQDPVSFEEYFEPLDAWFHARAFPDEDGLSVYFRDVTERRERERELEVKSRAMDELSTPLTMWDATGEGTSLVYANAAFERLTGYTAAGARGRSPSFLRGPETNGATARRIDTAVETGSSLSVEVRHYRRDGNPFWDHLEVTPVRDETGDTARIVGSHRDVSDRRERERRLGRLLETSRELHVAESATAVAERVVAALDDVLPLEAVAVRKHDPDRGILVPLAVGDATLSTVDRQGLPELDVGEGPVGTAFAASEPTLYRDAADEVDDDFGAVTSSLVVPLGDHGVITVGARDPDAFDGSVRDVVELLAASAEAALDRTSRERELREYETLVETVRDMLYTLDEEGRFRIVTPRLAEVLGHDPADLVGEPAATVLTEETAEEAQARVFDLVVDPDATDAVFEGELLTRDGEVIPVEIELSLLPYDDQFRGTVGTVRDITERRRRAEQLGVFRRAVDAAGVGLVTYDADGRFTYVNDQYASLLGHDRSTIGSQRVWETVPGWDADRFDAFWDTFEVGETRERETTRRRADGSTVPVETVTTAVTVDDTVYHVGTVTQIVDRRERREQVAVLHRVLRHNLRNDLSVIVGHAESLVADLDGDAADRARTVATAARRLADLADTAGDVEAMLEREVIRKPVDVVAAVETALDPYRDRPDVVVEADLPDERYVSADLMLSMAVEQLVSNAVEHNRRDVATVSVRVAETPSRSGWVDLHVVDDGPGIPEHEREVLTPGGESALEHGSGLGLWVVYWVVTRSGGELDFREDGEGSHVVVSLPAADREGGDGA